MNEALDVKASAPGTRGRAVKLDERVRVRLAYVGGRTEPPEVVSESDVNGKAVRVLAEYETTAKILGAAETLRNAGYKLFEAHSPFPIHGMDRAMGLRDSRLGWIVLFCGLVGVSGAWLLMYWTDAVDYPLIVGGKPPGRYRAWSRSCSS